MGNNINLVPESIEKISDSWRNKLAEKTNQAIDNVTNTLENSWQNVTDISNTTSGVVETAISSYISDMITQHPTVSKTVEILQWATSHPIISAVLLLFLIAFLWSIVKGIVRLIETASWSIFKIPLKLFQVIITVSFTKLFQLFKNKNINQNIEDKSTQQKNNQIDLNKINCQDKQKRLIEINYRLESIHQEQQELLKEASELIRNS